MEGSGRDDYLASKGYNVKVVSQQELKIKELQSEVNQLNLRLANEERDHQHELYQMKNQLQDAHKPQREYTKIIADLRDKYKIEQQHLKEKIRLEAQGKRGEIYDIAYKAAKEDIKGDFRKCSGDLYTEVSRQLFEKIVAETQRKEGKIYEVVHDAVYDQIHAEFVSKKDELEGQFYDKERARARIMNEKMDAERVEWENRYKELEQKYRLETEHARSNFQSLEQQNKIKLENEFARKAMELEQKLQAEYQQKENERQQEMVEWFEQFKKSSEEAEQKVTEARKERDREDIKRLEQALKRAKEEREKTQRQKVKYEEDMRKKYEQMLIAERASSEDILRDLKESHERSMRALSQSIEDERKSFISNREAAEDAHAKQLVRMKQSFDQEIDRMRSETSIFEDELQRKHQIMSDTIRAQMQEEANRRLKRAVEQLEQRALLEKEKSNIRFKAEDAAEQAVMQRFENLVENLRKGWQDEEKEHLEQQERRLRTHYETILKHSKQQLTMALSLNSAVDARWQEDIKKINESHLKAMQAFERKCRDLYDGKLQKFIKHTDNQMRLYQNELLEKGTEQAEKNAKIQTKVRRIKVACQRWRMDYQAEMAKRFESTIAEIESRYLREIKVLYVELSERREKDAVNRLLTEEKQRLEEKERDIERKRQQEQEEEKKKGEERKERTLLRLDAIRETLFKLWKALESSPEEVVPFLKAAFRNCVLDASFLQQCEFEHSKLASKLPLVQKITRREFVKYRLKMIHRFSQDPMKKADFAEGTDGAKSRDLLMAELRVLNEHLRLGIQEWEKMYEEKLNYRGVWYLHAMQIDSNRMPELQAAWAASVAFLATLPESGISSPYVSALNTTYCDLATAGGTGDVKTTRRNAAILGVFRSLSKTSELCGTRFVFILLYYAGIIAMIVNCAFGMALTVYMIHWVRKNDQLVLLAASKNLRVSHQDGFNDDDDDDDDDEYISDDEEDSQTNSDESDFHDEDSDYEEKEVQERRAKRTRGKKSSSSASIESVHLLSSNIDDNDFDRHDHATIKIRNNRKHFRKGMKIRAKKVNWNKPHTGQVVKYDKRTNSYLIEFGYGEQQMIPDECILGSVEEEGERRSGTNHPGSRESHSSRHRNSTDSGNSDTKTTLRFQDPEEYQHKRGSQTARQFSGRGISSSFNNHDNSFEFENNGNDFQRSDGGDIEMEKLESNPFISGRYTARQNNQTSM
eukprot:g1734.t1